MTKSLILTLSFVALCFATNMEINTTQVEAQPLYQAINGFLNGANFYNPEDSLSTCLGTIENIEQLLQVPQFYTQKDEIMTQFNQMQMECEDIFNFIFSAKTFLIPLFRQTIMGAQGNFEDMIIQFFNASMLFQAQDYYNAGYQLGQAYTSYVVSANNEAQFVVLGSVNDENTESVSGDSPQPKPPGPNDEGIPKFFWNDTNFIEGFSWEFGWSPDADNYENCITYGWATENATHKLMGHIQGKANLSQIIKDTVQVVHLANKTGTNCYEAYTEYHYFFQPVINATMTNETSFQTIVQNNLASHAIQSALYTAEMKSDFSEGNWYEAGIAAAKLAKIGFNGYLNNATNPPGDSQSESQSESIVDLVVMEPGIAYNREISDNTECQGDIQWMEEMSGRIEGDLQDENANDFINDFWYMMAYLPTVYNDCTTKNSEEELFMAAAKPLLRFAGERCAADVLKLTEQLIELRDAYENKNAYNLHIFKIGTEVSRTLIACGRLFI